MCAACPVSSKISDRTISREHNPVTNDRIVFLAIMKCAFIICSASGQSPSPGNYGLTLHECLGPKKHRNVARFA